MSRSAAIQNCAALGQRSRTEAFVQKLLCVLEDRTSDGVEHCEARKKGDAALSSNASYRVRNGTALAAAFRDRE